MRDEELWVKQMVELALGVETEVHDDGSAPSMHDLNIPYPDGPAALEITAAADGVSMALWKLVNKTGKRWLEPSISGGWRVKLAVGCRATALKKWLPPILANLESLGLTELNEGTVALIGSSSDELRELGILNAQQSSTGTDYPGSIYCTLTTNRVGDWCLRVVTASASG